MIVKDGVKMTANKYAKEMILDQLDRVLEGYWIEGNTDIEDYDWDINSKNFNKNIAPITQKEVLEIKKMIHKRIAGITKYLGYDNSNMGV
jgi:hypothetical protein|tara:strand:+ start:154 stop:423 length:270 start_codon:yes stop_codon:yes gene_type:complete